MLNPIITCVRAVVVLFLEFSRCALTVKSVADQVNDFGDKTFSPDLASGGTSGDFSLQDGMPEMCQNYTLGNQFSLFKLISNINSYSMIL